MAKTNLGSPSGAKLSLSLRNGRAAKMEDSLEIHLASSTSCVATFPTKIATEQQSLMLVKRLLAISVSCITYLRGILPESAYGTRYLDDLCVKILKEDKKCPGSTFLSPCLIFILLFITEYRSTPTRRIPRYVIYVISYKLCDWML
uniref:HORMA domain-containing protein n=1 Tax=Pseudonaja textilis TaxID=8673 RepID=A0A670Z654_PSETE